MTCLAFQTIRSMMVSLCADEDEEPSVSSTASSESSLGGELKEMPPLGAGGGMMVRTLCGCGGGVCVGGGCVEATGV